MTEKEQTAIDIIGSPLTLPCGLTLPNRLVKCPMQETCATPPNYDPPIDKWRNIYKTWAGARYGLIITGQVQVDLRFLSVPGDVAVHAGSSAPDVAAKWKEWASIAQANGTPTIVQLAHPGRMSPAGAGNRPRDMPAPCPSSVPVILGHSYLDKIAQQALLGTPKAMTPAEIDEAVENFLRGARLSRDSGFAGVQIHGAHGFLVSQFLSPHTNRRTDEYGGTPAKRLRFLQRLVHEIRTECPRPFCVSVKLNSGDYMSADQNGLTQDEALDQVRWLIDSGEVDFIEISGGNAEQSTSKLHNSFGDRSLSKAPVFDPSKRESTRIREAFFTEFAERVRLLQDQQQDEEDENVGLDETEAKAKTNTKPKAKKEYIPIQLSGGFRSRTGMADAIATQACDLIGLGRTTILEPTLPIKTLLNPSVDDSQALGLPHKVRGLWLRHLMPAKIVGDGLGIQFFYWNMRRLGDGLSSVPDASLLWVTCVNVWEAVRTKVGSLFFA